MRQSWRPWLVVFLLVVSSGMASAGTAFAADGCVTDAEFRSKLADVKKQHGTDTLAALSALDRAIGVEVEGGFGLTSIPGVDLGSGVSLQFATPYRMFRAFASSILLGLEAPQPPADVLEHIRVIFAPAEDDPVDIVKFVVERDGREVKPARGSVSRRVRLGGGRSLMGTLKFACSTFAPDARVAATATLKDGTKLTHVFTPAELASLK